MLNRYIKRRKLNQKQHLIKSSSWMHWEFCTDLLVLLNKCELAKFLYSSLTLQALSLICRVVCTNIRNAKQCIQFCNEWVCTVFFENISSHVQNIFKHAKPKESCYPDNTSDTSTIFKTGGVLRRRWWGWFLQCSQTDTSSGGKPCLLISMFYFYDGIRIIFIFL